MTDLDIIYEEVFGEEEDMRDFSMMMEKTKMFDKARTVYMYKGYAAVSCTKMLLKGIKKLRKKGFDSAKLDAYEKDLEEVLVSAKTLRKGGSIKRLDESKESKMMKQVIRKLNKYIAILRPVCQKYKVRLFTFGTGNITNSTIKNFNDFVILYASNAANVAGSLSGYSSGMGAGYGAGYGAGMSSSM